MSENVKLHKSIHNTHMQTKNHKKKEKLVKQISLTPKKKLEIFHLKYSTTVAQALLNRRPKLHASQVTTRKKKKDKKTLTFHT